MQKLLSLCFILMLTIPFGCRPDDAPLEATTNVELVFQGKYGEDIFLVNKEYEYDNLPIRFDQFNFFISNVVLVKEITGVPEETELVEIDFVDLSFKPADEADAARGFIVTAPNVPVGDYSAIKINLGVAPDLNKTSWDEYGSGHPLRRVEHFWAAWDSFIFSKTEARLDVNNDGSFTHKLAYHTGADEAYRTKFFAKEISLEEDQISKVTFEVDVRQMFDGVNVMTETGTHNISDMDLVNKVMDNLEDKAIIIQ